MNFYLQICDKLSIDFIGLLSGPITLSSNLTNLFSLINILQLPSSTQFRVPPTSFYLVSLNFYKPRN